MKTGTNYQLKVGRDDFLYLFPFSVVDLHNNLKSSILTFISVLERYIDIVVVQVCVLPFPFGFP